MINLFAAKRSKLSFSSFVAYLMLLVVIVASILSFSLYFTFKGILLQNFYSYSTNYLNQISASEGLMTNSVKGLIAQEYDDYNIRQLMYESQISMDDLRSAIARLKAIIAENDLQSVYIYNGQTKTFYSSNFGVYSNDAFQDKGIENLLESTKHSAQLKPIPRIIKITNGTIQNNTIVYTYIYEEINKNDGSILNAIVVNVSDDWMRNSISALDKTNTGSIIATDKNGVVVSSPFSGAMLTNISKLDFAKRILKSDSLSGHFVEKVNGEKSLVTYVSSDIQGWKFIMYTPYNVVLGQLTMMTVKIVIICFFALMLGLLIAYVVSSKMYQPIKVILDKLSGMNRSENKLKQSFFSEMLLSEEIISMERIHSQLKSLEIELTEDKPFLLVVLRIDHFAEFKCSLSQRDRSLFKFGIMNIASELLNAFAPNEAVDMNDDNVVLLMNTEENPVEGSKAKLKSIIFDIQNSVSKHLDISITAAISLPCNSVNQLYFSYAETLNISDMRMFRGPKSIIFADSCSFFPPEKFEYPANKENLLLDCIMQGKFDSAYDYCVEILDSTENFSHEIYSTTILRLFFANVMAINTLETSSGYAYSFDFNKYYFELTSLEFIDEIKCKFSSLYTLLAQKHDEKKTYKYTDLIHKVEKFIDTNYSKADLCLDTVADAQGLSPVYLGRLYKKYTNKSVGRFINEIRLQKASDLLTTSDVIISDIAKETGFLNQSYFSALFKKKYGITPNEFRQKAKCE